MKPSKYCPKLTVLADACDNGACNAYALIESLSDAIKELDTYEVREHPAIKVVLGQLSFLCGESPGPTMEAIQSYYKWRNEKNEDKIKE